MKQIARTIEDLPALKEGWIRLTHLTSDNIAEEIARNGLDYSKQGFIYGTARAFLRAEDAEYSTTDERFAGCTAVVLDVPPDEFRKHNGKQVEKQRGSIPGDRIVTAGRVPAEYVVGIVKPIKSDETNPKKELHISAYEKEGEVTYIWDSSEEPVTPNLCSGWASSLRELSEKIVEAVDLSEEKPSFVYDASNRDPHGLSEEDVKQRLKQDKEIFSAKQMVKGHEHRWNYLNLCPSNLRRLTSDEIQEFQSLMKEYMGE